MTRRPSTILALLLALLPGCGHRGNPLPPLRRSSPPAFAFRLAQRGDQIELSARAPAASVDGVPFDAVALEFSYGTGEVDPERVGTHLLVRTEGGESVARTVALPPPGTLLRATVRVLTGGQKSPRTAPKVLVVQAPIEAPRDLVAEVTADGVALHWQGVVPKEVPPPPVHPGLPGLPGSGVPTKPTTSPSGASPKPGTTSSAPAAKDAAKGEALKGETPKGDAPKVAAANEIPQAAAPQATALPAVAAPGSEKGAAEAKPAAGAPAGAPTAAGTTAAGTTAAGKEPETRRSGFYVYRRRGEAVYVGPLGEPLDKLAYKDATVLLGARTCYVVRAVASSEPLIESAASNEVCVVMRDVTPPAAPAGVTLMPRPRGLELIWSPSGESDLAGYRVFRTTAGGAAQKLAELTPAQTSYLDTSAQPGARYSYTVVAFDQAGNESAPSEAVEAGLP